MEDNNQGSNRNWRNNSTSNFRGRGNNKFRNVGRGRFSFPPEGNNRQRFNYNKDNNDQPREVRFSNPDVKSRIPRGGMSRRGRGGYGKGGGNAAPDPESQWFRIEIPHAGGQDKDWIMRTINASLDHPLTVFNYHMEGTTAVFSIDGMTTADTLRALSKRITKPDGYKLTIIVKPSTPPSTSMDENVTELIKVVMSRRYISDLGYLDLSNFKKDDEFTSKELYVSLDRPVVVKEVVKVIVENIPGLQILNLAENKIRSLEPLSGLKGFCSQLKAINLSKNKIQNMNELEHIKGIELDEIWLKENPCSTTTKDKAAFIRLSSHF